MTQIIHQDQRAKWREYYHKKNPKKPARVFYHPSYKRIVEHEGYATRIFWNKQMLEYLRKNYATTINEELAEWLGVSYRTVRRKAHQLGLKKDEAWLKDIHDERRKLAIASSKVHGNAGQFKKGQHASPATEFKKGFNKQAI